MPRDPMKHIKKYKSLIQFLDQVEARYREACKAIGKEDPSLTITDSHSDIPTLVKVIRDNLD
jgi:hypothetical protein